MIFLLFATFLKFNEIPLIPNEYSDIYMDVLNRAIRKYSNKGQEIPSMKPGFYEFPGLTFDLMKTLTSDNTDLIKTLSFSNDNKKVFLYQKNEKQIINENQQDTVIADKFTSTFYLLKGLKAKTGPVFMYETEIIEPLTFEIPSIVRVSSTPTNLTRSTILIRTSCLSSEFSNLFSNTNPTGLFNLGLVNLILLQ